MQLSGLKKVNAMVNIFQMLILFKKKKEKIDMKKLIQVCFISAMASSVDRYTDQCSVPSSCPTLPQTASAQTLATELSYSPPL